MSSGPSKIICTEALTDVKLIEVIDRLATSCAYSTLVDALKTAINNKSTYSDLALARICAAFRRAAPGSMLINQLTDPYIRKTIPAWHWSMLHDLRRNQAYETAISNCVSHESLVLEIGTGTGLLAILAARAGARHVYTCEVNEQLAEVANANIQRAGLSDRITIINKPAEQLRLGSDIPKKCNVLLHEMISGDIVGEGIVEIMSHVGPSLLAENAIHLPNHLSANVQPVGETTLVKMHHIDLFQDIDLSDLNYLSPATSKVASFDSQELQGTAKVLIEFKFSMDNLVLAQANKIPLSSFEAPEAIGFLQWISFSFPCGTRYENAPGQASHWRWRFHPLKGRVSDYQGAFLTCEYFDKRLIVFTLDRTAQVSGTTD